jgi:iron complex outermembrane recepter protein
VRGKLLWEPSALPGLSTKLTVSRNRSSAPQTEAVREPFSELRAFNDDQSVFRTIATAGIHDLRYAFGDRLVLTNRLIATDLDVTRRAPEGNGEASIDGEDYIDETTLTLTDPDARLSGLLGSYLRRTHNDEDIDLSDFLGLGEFDDTTTSLGLFGEATYGLTDRLDITLGLRYQRDGQDRDGFLGPFVVDYDESFDALLPKLALGYDVTNDLRVGAIASRGFNPGGTTISFSTGDQDRFDEETVWNYELFLRGRFLEDRLALNANLFYSDYSDFQRATLTGIDPAGNLEFEIDNADKARSYGLELDAELLATERLRLHGALGLLDTEITKFSASADEDVEGSEFALAPDVTATAGAAFELLDGLTVAGQVRYSDGYFSDDENIEDFEVDSYVVADARVSYRFRGVEAFAFVDNIFDEFYVLSDFGTGATVGPPREFGVGLRLRF